MPGFYSNDFSRQGLDAAGNTVFHPQIDIYGPGNQTFGNMVVGESMPYFAGPPVVPAAGGGITLSVIRNNAAPALPAPLPESRPLYVYNPELFGAPNYTTLTVDAYFDRPMAISTGLAVPLSTNPLDYIWALAVVLKEGNQNEVGVQKMVTTTCQFYSGGLVHFHGTDYKNDPLTTDALYEQQLVSTKSYLQQALIENRLTLAISRQNVKGAIVMSGTATLWLGASVFTGNLKLTGITNIDWVESVGVSLVNAKNLLPSISIRLTRFTISITP
jgi:hypothetical protein